MANDTPISERELEILRLVATGASNQQIAQQLSISINTVKVHLRNIFGKIGVVSRTEATLYAINNGLVSVDAAAGAALLALPKAEDLGLEELVEAAAPPLPAPGPASLEPPQPRPTVRPALRAAAGLAAAAILIAIFFGAQALGRSPAGAPTQIPPTSPAADTSAQRWFAHAALPTPRDGFGLAAYDQEHKLYVIGGRSGDTPSAAIDRFDPAGNLWVSLTDKSVAVSDAGAITLRGSIYVPGGIDTDGEVRDILEIYDPREQRWRQGAPIPAPRSRYALVAWEGRLYLIGGWDGTQPRAEVYIYDPQADRWSQGPDLPTPRQDAGAAVASGQIYVIGGSDSGGPLREGTRLDPTAEDAGWAGIAPLPAPVDSPSVVAPVGMLLVFDPQRRQGLQYEQASDAWSFFDIPADAALSSNIALLGTSIYFVADAQAATPGLVGEYRVLFTVFVPNTSGGGVTP